MIKYIGKYSWKITEKHYRKQSKKGFLKDAVFCRQISQKKHHC